MQRASIGQEPRRHRTRLGRALDGVDDPGEDEPRGVARIHAVHGIANGANPPALAACPERPMLHPCVEEPEHYQAGARRAPLDVCLLELSQRLEEGEVAKHLTGLDHSLSTVWAMPFGARTMASSGAKTRGEST
jgi:hypothetical protein